MLDHKAGHLFQGRFKSILVQNDAYLLRLSCYIHRNPLRAHIVERLADYKWSSYRYYAYKRKAPVWLKTKTILRQVTPPDFHKSYRIKVQQYSEEESSFLENIKHGFIHGTQEFIDEIKGRLLKTKKDAELPNKNSLIRDCDVDMLLQKGSRFLELDIKTVRDGKRVGRADRDNRDLLVYIFWKTGRFSNKEIGDYFGLSYSAVSQRAKIMNLRIVKEKALKYQYNTLKSLIKV